MLTISLLLTAAALIPPTLGQGGAPFSLGTKQLTPLNPPQQTANSTGQFDTVGVHRETFSFSDRQLNVSYWYPGLPPSDGSTAAYISGGGLIGNAAVPNLSVYNSSTPYPLIIFSPGDGAHDDAYYFYLQNLARHGFVVASINHWDATECGITGNLVALAAALTAKAANDTDAFVELLYSSWFRSTQFGLTYRPQEIGYVLNATLAMNEDTDSFLFGAIDADSIGLSGHSLGAFYSLIVGGGFAINCDYPLGPLEADTLNPILTQVNICAWPEAKALSSPTALHDSRIKAVLSLAPPFFNLNSSEITRAATSINTPVMIMTGNDASSESNLAPQIDAYTGAPAPKYMIQVSETDHLLVSDAYQFNPTLAADLPTSDLANFEEKADVYMVYSAAFFNAYLNADEESKEALTQVTSGFVADLQFED